jgi:hypothetical protein
MSPSLEPVFAFLFKYRPVVFQHGYFVLGWPRLLVFTLFGAVLVAPLFLRYGALRGKTRAADRFVLGFLRVAAAALVFSLAQPALVVDGGACRLRGRPPGRLAEHAHRGRRGTPRRTFIDENFGTAEDPLRALSER